MQTSPSNVSVLFANTGVQIICIPLRPNLRFRAEQLGSGWQRCKCQTEKGVLALHYIQWQIVTSKNQLLLAVDTTLGPNDEKECDGYFLKAGTMLGDHEVKLLGLLDKNEKPLEGLGAIQFVIRSATAEGGEPKDVHLVIDFGNNRTGGLLIEFHGDVAQDPLMHPLQLMHRYQLDAWDEKGELIRNHANWWFTSRSHWCAAPFLSPPQIEKEVWTKKRVKGMFGDKEVSEKTTIFLTPTTFQDFSQVRLGREANDLSLVMRTDGEVRTSVSSPKRYLWANDASWLDGANWYMADPTGQYDKDHHAVTLRGPLLRYIPENDLADLPEADYDESPLKPHHAPRTLMMGALYELLGQDYTYVNTTS